jgi:hypothetical protein
MIKQIFIFFFYLIAVNVGNAQPLSIQWQKCLGGTLGEAGYSITLTSDGGYLAGGIAISNDGDVSGNHLVNHGDCWVIKLDSTGNKEWQKCYGGSDEDGLSSIQSDSQSGFILACTGGSTNGDVIGMHGEGDFWILRCDSSRNILWQKCLGGADTEILNAMVNTYDHGYLAIGITESRDFDVVGLHDSTVCPHCSDAWLVRLDSVGTVAWTKCYGGFYQEMGYSIIQTIDSGFLFAASARSYNGDVQGIHGGEDYWIVKINGSGVIQWQKCFGGTDEETPNKVIQTKDGGYMVIGYEYSTDYDVVGHHNNNFYADAWLVKIDSSGNMEWQKCLGGSDDDIGKEIIQLDDSGYIVLCATVSTDGDLTANPPSGIDTWIVRLDKSGNILWQQCLGGSFDEESYAMKLTPDGGVILCGMTDSNDGDVSGNHGNYDVWVVKLAPLPDKIRAATNSITDFSTFFDQEKNLNVSFYANGHEQIQLQLFDIAGRLLLTTSLVLQAGFNQQAIPSTGLSSGMYFVRVDNMVKKVIANPG